MELFICNYCQRMFWADKNDVKQGYFCGVTCFQSKLKLKKGKNNEN